MARKTVKEKEQAYLAKKQTTDTSTVTTTYIPQPTNQDRALELLQNKGFTVTIKDSILYCYCKNEAEYKSYVQTLLDNFGQNKKVPFSFGATISKN